MHIIQIMIEHSIMKMLPVFLGLPPILLQKAIQLPIFMKILLQKKKPERPINGLLIYPMTLN